MKSMKCDVMKRNEMKWTSLPLDYTLSAFRTPLMAINCGLYILFLFFFEIIISFYLSLLFSASPTNVNTNALNISDVTARGLHFLSLSLSLWNNCVFMCNCKYYFVSCCFDFCFPSRFVDAVLEKINAVHCSYVSGCVLFIIIFSVVLNQIFLIGLEICVSAWDCLFLLVEIPCRVRHFALRANLGFISIAV